MRLPIRLLSSFLAGVAIFAAAPVHALDPARPVDTFTVTGWTMQDGLPHNLVHDILQDHEGFLWVSTWEGAARFNGRSFTRFDARSPAGPGIVGVRGMRVEADGSILFASTRAGVRRLHDGRWSALGDGDAQRLKVTTVLRDRDGSLWIGSEDSLYRLAGDGHLQAIGRELGLPGNFIHALLQVRDGEVLAGTSRGLFRVRADGFDPIGGRLGMPGQTLRTLAAMHDGSLVAGGDGGAWHIDADLGRARRIYTERVEAMIEDRHDVLWLSTTAHGLVRLQGERIDTLDARHGLAGRGSPALFEDREGLLWVGTTNGLFRIADGAAHGITVADGLADDYVRSLLEDADGAIWIGHALGVDRWQDGHVERIDLGALGLPPSSVLSLARADDGGVWLGTYDQGVLHVGGRDDGSVQIDRRRGLPVNHVRAVLQTRDGMLWIGTSEGLSAWRDGSLRRLDRADGLPSDFIRVLHEARDGTLWVGTSAGILAIHADGRRESWSGDAGFPQAGVFDFLDDADGTLWIATDRGLLRLRDGRFTRYDHATGLPGDNLFRILDDGHGTLWMSSNLGLFGVARGDFAALDDGRIKQLRVEVVDQSDGMPSSQANGGSSPAGARLRNGELWFPTSGGIAVLDPLRAARAPRGAVPVAFEQVVVDGRMLPHDAPMVLPATTRRIAIDFAGTSLRATRDVRYRYRMQGFDPRWFEAGGDAGAVFTNLPAGTFRFEVQAMLEPVDWSQAGTIRPASIEIVIETPFWRQTWFLGLLAIALLCLLGGLHRWRLARLRRREIRLAGLVEQRTHELSEKNIVLEQIRRQHEQALRQLSHQATHDVMTGLPNRRAGEHHLRERLDDAHRGNASFWVGLLDIDHFKRINDEHGHDAGDAVICMVGAVLREGLQPDGFVARHGGEEFMLSASDHGAETTRARVERLRTRIAATPVNGFGDAPLHCTVSIGVACWGEREDARSLLSLADRRLYRAKQGGRDRVVTRDDED